MSCLWSYCSKRTTQTTSTDPRRKRSREDSVGVIQSPTFCTFLRREIGTVGSRRMNSLRNLVPPHYSEPTNTPSSQMHSRLRPGSTLGIEQTFSQSSYSRSKLLVTFCLSKIFNFLSSNCHELQSRRSMSLHAKVKVPFQPQLFTSCLPITCVLAVRRAILGH